MAEYVDLMEGSGRRVASRRVRDVPWPVDPISAAEGKWGETRDHLERWLDENMLRDKEGTEPPAFMIDEVSVFFDQFEEDLMHAYIKEAVSEPHVKLFNHAWDHVYTDPIAGEYDVEYNFLEVRDLGMRVEVMRIDRGTSPLHASLGTFRIPVATPHVIHYSFKVDDLEEYKEVCDQLTDSPDTIFVQGCNSTYGAFSYWRMEDELGLQTFLKPRVNLRDAETPVQGVDITGVQEYEEAAQNTGEGHPTIGRGLRDLFKKGH